jgi:hypothetical protein
VQALQPGPLSMMMTRLLLLKKIDFKMPVLLACSAGIF